MPITKTSLTQLQETIERKQKALEQRKQELKNKLLAKVDTANIIIEDLEEKIAAAKSKRDKLLLEIEDLDK